MLLVPIYIVSSVSFILGLKMLSHPATARNGNLAAAAGMALAIFATIFMYIDPDIFRIDPGKHRRYFGCKACPDDGYARDGQFV